MTFAVRFTPQAQADLVRLYECILERDDDDLLLAERALDAIRHAIGALALSPFSYRKSQSWQSLPARAGHPVWRSRICRLVRS